MITNLKIKPKPCPFCGSTKITIEWEPCPPLDEGDTNRRWFAECTQCSSEGPFSQTEPGALIGWNHRSDTEQKDWTYSYGKIKSIPMPPLPPTTIDEPYIPTE